MVSLIKRTLVLLVMYLYFAPDIPAESHVVNNVDLFEPGQQSIEATKKADMQPFFSAWRRAVRTPIFTFRQPFCLEKFILIFVTLPAAVDPSRSLGVHRNKITIKIKNNYNSCELCVFISFSALFSAEINPEAITQSN